ncbi:MAG: hypothetical protein EON60_05145 [Alphaproteobacteria bacterium]|nr:MAG: hypothetical protein EON60_05145 [Alphaproteobacteria bacterium]
MNLPDIMRTFTREAGDYAAKKQSSLLKAEIQSKGGDPNNLFTNIDTENNDLAIHMFSPFVAQGGIFIGEESVKSAPTPKVTFGSGRDIIVVDPIDGTAPYIRQEASWGVICTYLKAGVPTLSIIYLPAQGKWLEITPEGTTLRIYGDAVPTLSSLPYGAGTAANMSKSIPNLRSLAEANGFTQAYAPSAAEMTVNLATGEIGLIGLPAKVGLWDIGALMQLVSLYGYSAVFEKTPRQQRVLGAGMFKPTWDLTDNLLVTSRQSHQSLYAA